MVVLRKGKVFEECQLFVVYDVIGFLQLGHADCAVLEAVWTQDAPIMINTEI